MTHVHFILGLIPSPSLIFHDILDGVNNKYLIVKNYVFLSISGYSLAMYCIQKFFRLVDNFDYSPVQHDYSAVEKIMCDYFKVRKVNSNNIIQ